MGKRQIQESFEIMGEWGLPGSTTQIAGTLSWEVRKAYLNLTNSFNPMRGPIHIEDSQIYPVIHGVTTNSEHITVLNAMRAGTNFSFGIAGVRQSEKLLSTCVVSGAHVFTDTLYSEMRVRIPGLLPWLCRSGITLTSIDKTIDNPASVIYQIEELNEDFFYVPIIQATLGWGIDRNFSADLISEIAVRATASLRITPDEPKNIGWYLDQIGKATTLLSFMAGCPMSPDDFEITLAGGLGKANLLVVLSGAKYCTHKTLSDFYMLRSAMDVDFSTVFIRWFEKYDTIAMPSQLALSILSSDGLWLHVEFLSFMQALEGFHRAILPGTYTTIDKYKIVGDVISNAIPRELASDHRDALKARIKYGNEISLRNRLAALVERLDESLRKFILGGDGKVPSSWLDTRNYYTHWDEVSREKILDNQSMLQAHVRMRHLIRALYFDLVGIPQTAILKVLCNASSDSQYLIQLNNRNHRAANPNDQSGAIMTILDGNADT
jgi:hypothetical protein